MQPGNPASRSHALPILATLFLCAYFFLFSYDGLNAYFTFDDGMNLVSLHRLWVVSLGTNVLDALKVFTAAYRPLGALVYRPLYSCFGFNPLPFRIVCYSFLVFNTVLAYRLFRALDATTEAATLATLLVCYNASMIDLYYNTGTIYDLLCFALYIGAVLIYVRHRAVGRALGFPVMLTVVVLFLAALDAKEMAVTLPAVLLLYEIVYRYRDWKSLRGSLRTASFLATMFAAAAIYVRVKVADMSNNAFYHPHLSISFILTGMGHYVEQLFYLKPESFGPVAVVIGIAVLLGCAAALRSGTVAYGTLFFVAGLLPLSVIIHRTGYAAYIAYPGLAIALATILTSTRSALMRMSKKQNLQTASSVVLFLGVAALSVNAFAHTRKILISNALWDQQRRIDLLTGLKRRIPEFPPNARVLMLDDPWPADWGQMFLTQLMYHDSSLWLDRVKNSVETGDRDSYDLLITYRQPYLATKTPRILGVRTPWEMHWIPFRKSEFTIVAPNENRATRKVDCSPSTAGAGRPITLTVPGLSNVKIDAIYRVLSSGSSTTTYSVEGWCTLDSSGACTVTAPHGEQFASVRVDWVRPAMKGGGGRWIFTNGALITTE